MGKDIKMLLQILCDSYYYLQWLKNTVSREKNQAQRVDQNFDTPCKLFDEHRNCE